MKRAVLIGLIIVAFLASCAPVVDPPAEVEAEGTWKATRAITSTGTEVDLIVEDVLLIISIRNDGSHTLVENETGGGLYVQAHEGTYSVNNDSYAFTTADDPTAQLQSFTLTLSADATELSGLIGTSTFFFYKQ